MVREVFKDTDSIALYKTMKETLVYLTHLDYKDTEQKMTEKLATQVCLSDRSPFYPFSEIGPNFS